MSIMQNKIKLGHHGNIRKGIKTNVDAYKEDSNKYISFGKSSRIAGNKII